MESIELIDGINRTDWWNQSNWLMESIETNQPKKTCKYSIDFDRPIDQFNRPINISIEFDRFDNAVS